MRGRIDIYPELALLQLVETEEIFSRDIIMDQLHKTKRRAKILAREKLLEYIQQTESWLDDATSNRTLAGGK